MHRSFQVAGASQFSTAAAGALAAKKAYLGAGEWRCKPLTLFSPGSAIDICYVFCTNAGSSPFNIKPGKSFGTFATGGAITSGASTAAAAGGAAAAQAEQKPSVLRRLAQVLPMQTSFSL
jgi:hypothetical protein